MGKPIYVRAEQQITQPSSRVWHTVALEFGHVANYNPEIQLSRYDSQLRRGVGTRRHCEFPKGGFIEEEIIQWDDPKSFRLRFTRSSVPMGYMESRFSFDERDDHTLVVQEMWFRLKAPLGWLSPLMKAKMQSTIENGLKGLIDFLKSK